MPRLRQLYSVRLVTLSRSHTSWTVKNFLIPSPEFTLRPWVI